MKLPCISVLSVVVISNIHNMVIPVFGFLAIKSIKTIKAVATKPPKALSMSFMLSMAIHESCSTRLFASQVLLDLQIVVAFG